LITDVSSVEILGLIQPSLKEIQIVIESVRSLIDDKGFELFTTTSSKQAWKLFQKLLSLAANHGFDVAVLPVATRSKKLLVCDMDATIVTTETLDDLAGRLGIGGQVSDITARAMQGDLDFRQALQQRIKLLSGQPVSIIHEVAASLQFNPGAEDLLRSAKQHGMRTVLVSGGFEQVVSVVVERLGFDCYICNRLAEANAHLTGSVLEPVVDGNTKLTVLLEACRKQGIDPAEACAIGDGANDLPMLQAAGLGIAYQGKPLLKDKIPYQINASGLDVAALMMGIAG